jgi:hypothetical protein
VKTESVLHSTNIDVNCDKNPHVMMRPVVAPNICTKRPKPRKPTCLTVF